jgi:hypothetical protein
MIISIILIILYALWESKRDFDDIEADVTINKVERWSGRALVGGAIGFVLWGPLQLIVVAFLFSLVHRYDLNRRRGRSPFYVAPWSSFYDRAFYSMTSGRWFSKEEALLVQRNYILGECTEEIYEAGKAAYVVELTVILLVSAI